MPFGHSYDDDAVTARQVTPLTVHEVAAWCGGTVELDEAGNQQVRISDDGAAGYGWWVVEHAADPGVFAAVDPVEFNRTFREA